MKNRANIWGKRGNQHTWKASVLEFWSKPSHVLREHSNCYLPLGWCWKPVNLHNEALCLKKVTRGGIWVREKKFGLNINLQQLSNKTATQAWQVHERQPEEEKSGGKKEGRVFCWFSFGLISPALTTWSTPPALFCELEVDERSFLNPGVDRPLRRTFLELGGVKMSD